MSLAGDGKWEMDRPSSSFPFLTLPGELRNRIYTHLLTNTRNPSDRVFLTNDLTRRSALRSYQPTETLHGMSKQARKAAKKLSKAEATSGAKFHFLNRNSPAMQARFSVPATNLPPLLEVGILRACRQTHAEGLHVLYDMNTFATIFLARLERSHLSGFFPRGVDLSRITRLRVEYMLPSNFNFGIRQVRTSGWAALGDMQSLKHLRILVTFEDRDVADTFNHCWRFLPPFLNAMRDLISEVPTHIEHVSWGLEKEEKESGDHAGLGVAKGCVLRKIYATYEGLRGVDVEAMKAVRERMAMRGDVGSFYWNETVRFVQGERRVFIDGDGMDSDQEA